MTSKRLRHSALMAVFLTGIAACGGGTQLAGGGIGGTGISQGSITGFGSVWVNGVEFDTNNTTIIKDGTAIVPISQDELKQHLKIGMVVTIDGSINSDGISGTATSVSYTKELQGPISDKPNANSLTVLGQTVIIDDLTKIIVNGNAATIGDLNTGDTVEVSGFLSAGGIRATYIEVKSSSTDVELKGIITAINGSIITIGGQDIDISMAAPSFTPAVDDYVEVKGSVGTPLQASSIEKKSRALGSGSADKAEIEGFITTVTTGSDFVVDAQRVQTTAQTVFSGGAVTDIKTGIKVEVNGALSNGILVATKVSFEDDLSVEGNISSTNGDTLILDTGLTIEVNSILTEGYVNPSSLTTGSHVKIRGRKLDPSCATNSCTLLATELEVVTVGGSGGGGGGGGGGSGSTPTELQCRVDAVDKANQSITILGQAVDLSAVQSFSGTDSAGNEITDITGFFDAIKPGDLVQLKGTNTNGTVSWDSIELED